MRQWTTPTEELTVEGVDLTGCDVWVSITQGARTVEVRNPQMETDGTDTTLYVELTQAQTGRLKVGKAEVQVNWLDAADKRNATETVVVDVTKNLLRRVVNHGN